MNGLKYIRTRCNISLSELADIIGVSRQAINAWETEKKSIPPQRLKQLSEYFGIEKKYLGNISESDKQYLLEKAMFRYFDGEKETYLYRLKSEAQTPSTTICFPGDRESSLDERYINTQRKMKQVLEKSSEIIRYYDKGGTIQGQISCINRGCRIYDTLNTIMDEMPKQAESENREFWHEHPEMISQSGLNFPTT